MKILTVKKLAIPEIKIIRFAKFLDERGFFSETFRASDLAAHPELTEFKTLEFTQANESFSKPNVLRGLHFQWNPYMGKLVRVVSGTLIDLALDIRKGSAHFGKIIAVELLPGSEFGEWVWIPPGFAHGVFLPEGGLIEYLCSGIYNPDCEACVSPLAEDLDWSLCDIKLKAKLDETGSALIISEKDKKGLSLRAWQSDPRSNNFIYKT